jgi:hypothetical protein
MKKLFFTLMLAASGFTINGFSQTGGCGGGPNNCNIAVNNIVVTIVSAAANPGNASQTLVTFNVSFDLDYNNGNTDFFINSFLQADYPAPAFWPCSNGNNPAPTNALASGKLGMARDQLQRSFLDIELSNPARGAVGVPVPMTIATTYQYDNTVVLTSPLNSPGMTATKVFLSGSTDRVTINNANVILNSVFGSPILVKTDVWAQNGNAHCYVAGIVQGFNDPAIAGFKNCSTPDRQYTLGITTANTTPTTLTYSVWIDMNSNGIIDGGDIQAVGPVNYPNFSNVNPFSTGGPVSYPPYSSNPANASRQLIISASTPAIGNSITKIFPHPAGCIGLPVNFNSFTAVRNGSTVSVKWVTSSEENSRGFAIERNNGNGVWVEAGFVPSQAAGGNSSSEIAYQFADANNSKTITQYRIRQVDLNDKSKYSDVRSIRGIDQKGGIIVYPNPSNDGKINIVFEDRNVIRDVAVTDMGGRLVKQMKSVTSNSVVIDNLVSGMYTIRITVPATGEQLIEKLIVNKH